MLQSTHRVAEADQNLMSSSDASYFECTDKNELSTMVVVVVLLYFHTNWFKMIVQIPIMPWKRESIYANTPHVQWMKFHHESESYDKRLSRQRQRQSLSKMKPLVIVKKDSSKIYFAI
ncbi:Hypothetical predicted protein [Octopus vulgaris]|uniref:Uncharacterized protein n=1 Tax=Octopus vulgaris TaxID=6645 RepID=A0AA36AYS4_OCTVU|nr:Hypothetical predicted protein [Octopus vulgaris]